MVMGAAWGPQRARMDAGIYFPLYLVLVAPHQADFSIFYLSADLQPPDLFEPRKPLSPKAKRKGWQGYLYNLEKVAGRLVRLPLLEKPVISGAKKNGGAKPAANGKLAS